MTTPQSNLSFSEEEWRSILDGFYEVSNLGRIRRAKIGKMTAATEIGRVVGTWLSTPNKSSKGGYCLCHLSCDNKVKNYTVHKLVAEAFLGPRPAGMEVNHKDGVKTNNRSDNLEYVTKKNNAEHAIKTGLYKIGERHWKAKITESQVLKIRSLNLTTSAIARMFNLTQDHVRMIRRRRIWKMI